MAKLGFEEFDFKLVTTALSCLPWPERRLPSPSYTHMHAYVHMCVSKIPTSGALLLAQLATIS